MQFCTSLLFLVRKVILPLASSMKAMKPMKPMKEMKAKFVDGSTLDPSILKQCRHLQKRRSGPCGNRSRKNQGVHSKHKKYRQLKLGDKQGAAAVVHNRTYRAKKKAENRDAEFMSTPLLAAKLYSENGKTGKKKRAPPSMHYCQ